MKPFRSSEWSIKAIVGGKPIDFDRLVASIDLNGSARSTFACISVAKSHRVSELSNTRSRVSKSILDRSVKILL